MMITRLFCFDVSEKKFFKSQKVKQKLRHQVAEALRVEAKAIQKLPLPHPLLLAASLLRFQQSEVLIKPGLLLW